MQPAKRLMVYLKKETTLLIWGIIFLFLGTIGQFVVPLYVGWVIDAMVTGDWDIIGRYCLELLLIIVVRKNVVN